MLQLRYGDVIGITFPVRSVQPGCSSRKSSSIGHSFQDLVRVSQFYGLEVALTARCRNCKLGLPCGLMSAAGDIRCHLIVDRRLGVVELDIPVTFEGSLADWFLGLALR